MLAGRVFSPLCACSSSCSYRSRQRALRDAGSSRLSHVRHSRGGAASSSKRTSHVLLAPQLRANNVVTRASQLPRGAPRPLAEKEGGDPNAELVEALMLCTDEELDGLEEILFGVSPLSPLLKTAATGEESWLHSARRQRELDTAELTEREAREYRLALRLRFLAADAMTTLQGKRPTYRQVLLGLKDQLEIRCSSSLSTADLEAEIYLHLCSEQEAAQASDAGNSQNGPDSLLAPLQVGGQELLQTFASVGAAAGTAALRRAGLGKGAAAIAARGLGRVAATRGALATLGPALWGWLAVDLALKAMGSDHGRVARAVFALAQIRLLRTEGWTQAPE